MKRALAFVASSAVVALAAACVDTTSTTTYIPITGIVVRADSLTAGHGCGTGDGEVYKYVALVIQNAKTNDAGDVDLTSGQLLQAGTYDCFADAAFANLSGQSFALRVYAFDAKAFSAALTGGAACVLDPRNATNVFGACQFELPDGGGYSAQQVSQVETALESAASRKTTCSATPQNQIQVLAVCGPLR